MSALTDSTSTGSIELTTDADTADLVAAIKELAAENRELRDQVNQQADRIDTLEAELEETNAALAEAESELAETSETVEDSEKRLDAVSGGLSNANAEIDDIDDRLDRLEEQRGDGSESTDQRIQDTIETPLERVVAYTETAADEELHPNERRARAIARDVREYATKTPKGYVLKSTDIRTVLAAMDESSHPETVSRVIEFLDELGKDDVEVVKRRGTRRVAFSEELVERLAGLAEADITTCVMGNPVEA